MTDRDRAENRRLSVDPAAVDDAFGILADGERRAILYALRERGEQSIDELADVVAGRRAADEDRFVSPALRARIRIELDHVQLPMLDDDGLVEYDRAAGRVTIDRLPAAVEALLDLAVTDPDDPTIDPLPLDDESHGGQ